MNCSKLNRFFLTCLTKWECSLLYTLTYVGQRNSSLVVESSIFTVYSAVVIHSLDQIEMNDDAIDEGAV